MATAENPHAGQGSVVLDIGGDIGALIVTMPTWMEDVEVEIIPSGTDGRSAAAGDHDRSASHHHHHTGPGHHHAHADHDHAVGMPPHVAVVARRAPDGSTIHSLVFGELKEGTYDLYVRPAGPIALTASVTGGEITEAAWPDSHQAR